MTLRDLTRKLEWELEAAASSGRRELRRAVTVMNDQAVPAVRAEASVARRGGARLLRNWADRLDRQPTGAARVGPA